MLPLALAAPIGGSLVAAVVVTQTLIELLAELADVKIVPRLIVTPIESGASRTEWTDTPFLLTRTFTGKTPNSTQLIALYAHAWWTRANRKIESEPKVEVSQSASGDMPESGSGILTWGGDSIEEPLAEKLVA